MSEGIAILKKSLPIIGHLKIGEATPKKSPMKGAPRKFDHLEITGTQRDQHQRLIFDTDLNWKLLQEPYAETCGGCDRSKEIAKWLHDSKHLDFAREVDKRGLPTTCGIYLPADDIDLVFPRRLAYYRGRVAYCVGDGENPAARRQVVKETVKNGKTLYEYGDAYAHEPCGPACPDFQSRRCRPHAKLQFVLSFQENVGGCYQFSTTSWNTIPNIQWGLRMVSKVARGHLAWVPLIFKVVPQTVTTREGITSQAYVCHITYPDGPAALLREVSQRMSIEAPLVEEIRQLEVSTAGDTGATSEYLWNESGDEIAAIEAEFRSQPEPLPDFSIKTPSPPVGAPEDNSEQTKEPDAEEQPEVAGSLEAPIPEEGPPEVRSPDADPERPKIETSQYPIFRRMATMRARKLGFDAEDAGHTVLAYALASMGIGELEDVRADEKNQLLDAIKSYSVRRVTGHE